MPRPIRPATLTVALLALLELSGCATAAAPAPTAATSGAVAVPGGPEYGIIAAMRPVLAPVGDPGARILAAIGMGTAAGNMAAGDMEFVIREDDGRTLSVIQANDRNFRAGERVTLSPGPRLRVSRLADAGS